MRIAHSVLVTPHKCGLYETAREMAEAERALGADARIVTPNDDHEEEEDRGVPIVPLRWADDADVIINHSGQDNGMRAPHVPRVHIMHATPYHKFLLEHFAPPNSPYTYLYYAARMKAFKAFVTLWKEHLDFWSIVISEDRLHFVPAPVNLSKWRPLSDDEMPYNFASGGGAPNIVYASPWRPGHDGFYCVQAFMKFAQLVPGAKLHIYSAPPIKDIFKIFCDHMAIRGNMGEVRPIDHIIPNMRPIFASADIVLASCRVGSRVVREALACGAQVVMARGVDLCTPFYCEPHDVNRFAEIIRAAWTDRLFNKKESIERNRSDAVKHFDSANTAKGIIAVCEKVLGESKE